MHIYFSRPCRRRAATPIVLPERLAVFLLREVHRRLEVARLPPGRRGAPQALTPERGTTGSSFRGRIHARCPGLGQRMSETAKDHRQLMACDCEPSFARGVGATQALFDCSEAEVDHVQKELLVCSNLVRVFHNNTQHNNTQSIFCCFLRVIGDRAERDLFDCSIWGNAIESQVAGWPPFPVPASKHNKFSVTCAPHEAHKRTAQCVCILHMCSVP